MSHPEPLRDRPPPAQYPHMTTTPIPSLLRSMRQTLGITQDELATAWGVSRRTIAAWEAGETGTENLR